MTRGGFTHEKYGSEAVDYWTPPEIFEALNVAFDLDVCAPIGGVPWLPVSQFFTPDDDGLIQPWRGLVWMNPPYGVYTPRWMKRFVEHGNGLALVFARTDTAWFQRVATRASLILFLRGRIRFIDGAKRERAMTPGAGSCLIACGNTAADILMRTSLQGVRLHRSISKRTPV